MIKVIVFDLCRVLLFPKDTNYEGELNYLNQKLLDEDRNYPFLSYFFLDDILLSHLAKHKSNELFIFTSGTIQNAPDIRVKLDKVFKKIYSAEDMHVKKSEPEAYRLLCDQLELNPNEVLFIDDYEKNTNAAKKAGLHTLTFRDRNEVIMLLKQLR